MALLDNHGLRGSSWKIKFQDFKTEIQSSSGSLGEAAAKILPFQQETHNAQYHAQYVRIGIEIGLLAIFNSAASLVGVGQGAEGPQGEKSYEWAWSQEM